MTHIAGVQLSTNALVSIVIPTMNSASMLPECLDSLGRQTWKNTETIVVDGFSKDGTVEVARSYGTKVVRYGPRQDAPFQRIFGAPYQWNHGASLARGDYLYLLGSDIRLSPKVIEECVILAERDGHDAMVIPEVSYGEGFWAQCKRLQRSFLLGDNSIESPMFLSMKAWKSINGLDPRVEGYMDWDLTNRLTQRRFKIGRVESRAFHYEGRLQLTRLLRKKYVYGKATRLYLAKYPKNILTVRNLSRFGFVRMSYARNLPRILANPKLGAGFVAMTLSEYLAVAFGAMRGKADPSDAPEICTTVD